MILLLAIVYVLNGWAGVPFQNCEEIYAFSIELRLYGACSSFVFVAVFDFRCCKALVSMRRHGACLCVMCRFQ